MAINKKGNKAAAKVDRKQNNNRDLDDCQGDDKLEVPEYGDEYYDEEEDESSPKKISPSRKGADNDDIAN